jgi:hypothetical protein
MGGSAHLPVVFFPEGPNEGNLTCSAWKNDSVIRPVGHGVISCAGVRPASET